MLVGRNNCGKSTILQAMAIWQMIDRWFSLELLEPKYEKGVDTRIVCEYKQRGKTFDIIAGGSGFHQALTHFDTGDNAYHPDPTNPAQGPESR